MVSKGIYRKGPLCMHACNIYLKPVFANVHFEK